MPGNERFYIETTVILSIYNKKMCAKIIVPSPCNEAQVATSAIHKLCQHLDDKVDAHKTYRTNLYPKTCRLRNIALRGTSNSPVQALYRPRKIARGASLPAVGSVDGEFVLVKWKKFA